MEFKTYYVRSDSGFRFYIFNTRGSMGRVGDASTYYYRTTFTYLRCGLEVDFKTRNVSIFYSIGEASGSCLFQPLK